MEKGDEIMVTSTKNDNEERRVRVSNRLVREMRGILDFRDFETPTHFVHRTFYQSGLIAELRFNKKSFSSVMRYYRGSQE
jgi:hypothetical protein